MTGCGGVKVVSPEAGSSGQKTELKKIKTPEDEKVVLNIVDWSDSTKDAREKLNEQFMNLYLEEEFFAQIQPEFLCENVTRKGEDVYLLPEAIDIPSALLFYNRALLEEAGVEIDPERVTWEEFQQVCEKVTENGDGKYYGMVASGAQKNRMDIELRAFSEVAGAKLGPSGHSGLGKG